MILAVNYVIIMTVRGDDFVRASLERRILRYGYAETRDYFYIQSNCVAGVYLCYSRQSPDTLLCQYRLVDGHLER